ncbi:40339_t:CDS:2 [Gigaspora margarita]|uniref:40339_t:CDS:1 n=1 Tax=Gigaspora margarita TaxID=4874 RepID=A0ABM8VWQ1_GIGMA|nr:40339_t:CDS:2 [Gigaspora margarita]
MPHRKIYQYVEKVAKEKKINLIEYERFSQPPSGFVDSNNKGKSIVKLLNNKPIILSLIRNLEQYDDKAVGNLMIELKQFVHDNVLKVHGLTYGEYGTSYFIVREYASKNLRVYLSQMGAPLVWEKKLTLTSRIVDGLKFLHYQGVVHSELNPMNIVMHDEIPKLTNIGMSQIRQSDESLFSKYDPPEIWHNRPNCAKILEELKKVSPLDVYKIENPSDVQKSKPRTFVDTTCELDYAELLKSKQLKANFINHLSLNKGRNLDGFDFSPAKEFILHDNGNLKIDRVYMRSPTIFLPKSHDSPWIHLNNSSLFGNQEKDIGDSKDDDARIHVPVATVIYTCKSATNEFIEKIRTALNFSDTLEIKKNLRKVFNDYGNYVAKKVTLGGVITIRNWSRVSAESRSYLRCYIQWAILYGKGGASKIFEEVPLDRIPKLEASINMITVGDLYTWFKGIYERDHVDVISYEEVIPSYELLPDNLKNQIFKVMNFAPNEKSYISLIPNIPTDYDKQDILKWIIKRPPHQLHLSDWVQNKLQHGVILRQLGLGHGKYASFKFLREPRITEINKIIVSLIQPKTRQEAYLLENGIILTEEDGLELEKIPFAEYSSTLNHPLEDFKNLKDKHSKTIYCQVSFNAVKISFNLSDIKVLPDFSFAVNSALQSNSPFKNLCELFGNDYGHLLSRTFTLGGTLSKKYESLDIILPQKFVHEYDIADPQTPQNIKDKLKEWNDKFQDLDTLVFLNNSGDIIYRNKLEEWLIDLSENRRGDWNVVASEDWMPLYKIMKRTHKVIDEIFDDTYHVVCNGEESLSHESLSKDQTTKIIKFPESLFDDKYFIYGVVVMRNDNGNWEANPKISVRFDYPNNNGCAAYIYKNCDISLIKEDIKLLWFVLGSPKGFCSNMNRSVKVNYGEFDVDHTQPMVKLTSKKLTSNCVLITSIVSRKDTIFYTIKPRNWSTTTINIEIQEDLITSISNSEENVDDGYEEIGSDGEQDDFEEMGSGGKQNDYEEMSSDGKQDQEKVVLRWCIVDLDERGFIVGEGNMYPLSLFGDFLSEDNEIFDVVNSPIEPRFPPQMSLEYAIKQHTEPNGNTLEAWKTFVKHSRKGEIKADYWIGYYLQQDILKSKTLYEEDIEDVIQGEDTYIQAAMRYYQKAANSNHPEAQLRYGFGLYYGHGINMDKKEAARYFKLAAENNNPTAMYNLGAILLFGDNKKEKEDGEHWLIKAARLGQSKAIEICNQKNIKYCYP